ncbi:hypothetical protein BKA65DRAFT_538040 [Rhexocercosporidium sp. MPI-PUGE-AT-0058]|nr:hypothetical protein BKA65DRAFT_538040 [Rhexocercosporidium sp. MPI-PUGE-AT-0058]
MGRDHCGMQSMNQMGSAAACDAQKTGGVGRVAERVLGHVLGTSWATVGNEVGRRTAAAAGPCIWKARVRGMSGARTQQEGESGLCLNLNPSRNASTPQPELQYQRNTATAKLRRSLYKTAVMPQITPPFPLLKSSINALHAFLPDAIRFFVSRKINLHSSDSRTVREFTLRNRSHE